MAYLYINSWVWCVNKARVQGIRNRYVYWHLDINRMKRLEGKKIMDIIL